MTTKAGGDANKNIPKENKEMTENVIKAAIAHFENSLTKNIVKAEMPNEMMILAIIT